MTADCPPTKTLIELWDWKARRRGRRRLPTTSERLEYAECDRRVDDAAPEKTMDWVEDEQYMDTDPSPTQRTHAVWTTDFQARKDACK